LHISDPSYCVPFSFGVKTEELMMSEYLNILSAIMRVDNTERNAAEARLSQLTEADAASSALALVEIMGSTNVSFFGV
jgi:hypothetical protein